MRWCVVCRRTRESERYTPGTATHIHLSVVRTMCGKSGGDWDAGEINILGWRRVQSASSQRQQQQFDGGVDPAKADGKIITPPSS